MQDRTVLIQQAIREREQELKLLREARAEREKGIAGEGKIEGSEVGTLPIGAGAGAAQGSGLDGDGANGANGGHSQAAECAGLAPTPASN